MAVILLWMDAAVGKDRIKATLKHHRLIAVNCIAEALNELNSQQIDLIIAGVNFEHESVFDLLRAVKSENETARIPFVICRGSRTKLSQSMTEALRLSCSSLGAQAYLDERELYSMNFVAHIEIWLGVAE